jgi:hypothetical protein
MPFTDFLKSNKIITIMAIDYETVKIVPQMAEDVMVRIMVKTTAGIIIKISHTSKTMTKIGNNLPGQSKLISFQAG